MSNYYLCNDCGSDFETSSAVRECPFCESTNLIKEVFGKPDIGHYDLDDDYYEEDLEED